MLTWNTSYRVPAKSEQANQNLSMAPPNILQQEAFQPLSAASSHVLFMPIIPHHNGFAGTLGTAIVATDAAAAGLPLLLPPMLMSLLLTLWLPPPLLLSLLLPPSISF
jgi:hypothetical protein